MWADLDGSNNLLTRYFHGDQVDQLLGRQDSGTQYWYVTDYQGSVRDVLDNSGAVKDAISYDGWGNIISETNSAYRGNYAWTGRMLDVETGLQYNRARWYDPSTGRWQTQDPMGFEAGDSNLYRYVMNQSVNAVDPSGLDSFNIDGGTLTVDLAGSYKTGIGLGVEYTKPNVKKGFLQVWQRMQFEVTGIYTCEKLNPQTGLPCTFEVFGAALPPGIDLDPGNEHGHKHITGNKFDSGNLQPDPPPTGITTASLSGDTLAYKDIPSAGLGLFKQASNAYVKKFGNKNQAGCELTGIQVVQRFVTVIYLGGSPVVAVHWTNTWKGPVGGPADFPGQTQIIGTYPAYKQNWKDNQSWKDVMTGNAEGFDTQSEFK